MPHPGEAFGSIRETNTVVTQTSMEIRADEFGSPYESHSPLWSLLPDELADHLGSYPALVGEAVGQWHSALEGAAGMIVNHASNDVLILLSAVEQGDGRTAARTVRVLFEHLTHYMEISSSEGRARQYEQHRHVTADQLARQQIGLRRLRGKSRSKEQQWLKNLGKKAQAPLKAALEAYGTSYSRGWTAGTSTYALACRHGLKPDYDSYRILSGVMHGSAGALLGTRRERTKLADVTHRLGPDLRLAPLAYHEGLRWWRQLLDHLPSMTVPVDWAVDLAEATDALLGAYQDLHDACRRLDNQLWPTGAAAPRTEAVYAIYPGGKTRWFCHNPQMEMMRLGELIGPEPPNLEQLREQIGLQAEGMGGRPVTVRILGAEVRPSKGSRPIHASAIQTPHELFGWDLGGNG